MGCNDYITNEEMYERQRATEIFNKTWNTLSTDEWKHVLYVIRLENRVKKLDQFLGSLK